MPRFYFHTKDGQLLCDDDGTELPDVERAKGEALTFLGELLRNNPGTVLRTGTFQIIVADKARNPQFTVEVSIQLAPI
jgi:hypothetical protein